ncbi:FAD-binding domain-containing protein [Delitschia confertaspora ATCC 74209]|uniref:FAD-binding domain-containing protein n=1 Tax=Delitschia confertaspora ATCC 74209 TaxID=1513339 RepID=A0A9P4JYQ0_9PLEO|nr:FAD-binding domain-containing protein [Delitschia confertaspora ATCC 74209]
MVAASSLWQTVLGLSVATNLTTLFGPHLSPQAEILHPTDKNFYAKLRQRWTDYRAPSYGIGAIKPVTAKDVQATVQIANEHGLPFFVTAGGHGISDYSTFNGLSIDLSHFDTVESNAEGDRITIGGAVKIHQLIEPLAKLGRELPLGSCMCVGVVGATLGGGIGGLHGYRGLLLDLLEEVEVVTASGDLIKASATENEDLFWALRGAGSNFGIVTSATYRLPEISNKGMYVNADFVYPAERNHSFWQVMADFDESLPSRLAITAVSFFNRITNKPVIAVNAVFYGALSDALPFLKPFESLKPVMSNISSVPAEDIMDAAFFNFFGKDNGACTPNQHINIYTVALKRFHPPTFEAFFSKLVGFWQAHPAYQGRLLMQRYSTEGPMATADDATAYAYRDVKTFMNIEGFYPDSTLDDAVNDFSASGREEFLKTSGFDGLGVYSNTDGTQQYARGDEGPVAWYGERKLARLSELKRKWDPKERLSVNNPVPLNWPSQGEESLEL